MCNFRTYSLWLATAIVAILLLLHLIPSVTLGDYTLRQVDILKSATDMIGMGENTPDDNLATLESTDTTDSLATLLPAKMKSGKLIRIAYYGDSFIEGDIMVEEVRRQLQKRYGGQGVGWVDAGNEITNSRSAVTEQYSGLTEHLAMKHETYRADKAGVSERYYDAEDGAHLQLRSKQFSPNTDRWDVARFFLKTNCPVSVTVKVEGGATEERKIAGSPHVQMIETRGRMNNIDYTIHGSGATVYGVALESDSGIVVDNFSMRGTSGVSLPYVPAETLQDFARYRPYDLIILQYGVNAIPPRATEEQCEWYMKRMKKTLAHIRKCFPKSKILLVSTPDRGTKSNGVVTTAPGIPMLVRHQQELAKQEGVPFFSLFDAMGGDGAMGKMLEKGEAAADLIHITREGGKDLAGRVVAYLTPEADSTEEAYNDAVQDSTPAIAENALQFKGFPGCLVSFIPTSPLLFNSSMFLLVMLFFTLVYVILRNRTYSRMAFVVLFSLYYYYKCSGLCVLLLVMVTVVDYFLSRKGKGNKACLWISILMNIGILLYLKYADFFVGFFADRSSLISPFSSLFSLAGISFFTFRSLSYSVDVYKGRCKPAESLLDYAFYLTFFPVLLAGPITRANQFLPQVRRQLSVSSTMFARGTFLIAVGLVKKAVISDYIGINFVDRVFDNPTLFTGGEVLFAIYGYCFQIYCDFSGYSDMAIGIALFLGFHIPDNFRKPFAADSMSDFWRRWHISLSTWIRDYIYIPLGGSRCGRLRAWVNQIVAMTLCGLWHGASLTFVIWGAVHGLLVCVHKFFSQVVLKHDRHYHPMGWRRWVAVFFTFHLLCATWVLFRAADLATVGNLFYHLFAKFDVSLLPKILNAYRPVFLLIFFAVVMHFIPTRLQRRCVAMLSKTGLVGAVLLLVAVIYMVAQVKASDIVPFIYFQF